MAPSKPIHDFCSSVILAARQKPPRLPGTAFPGNLCGLPSASTCPAEPPIRADTLLPLFQAGNLTCFRETIH
jgi:hypothetical protein